MSCCANAARAHRSAVLKPLPDDVGRPIAGHRRGRVAEWRTGAAVRRLGRGPRKARHSVPGASRSCDPAGALWVCWPKRAAKRPTDLTEDVVRAVGLDHGLVDVKVCAVDEVCRSSSIYRIAEEHGPGARGAAPTMGGGRSYPLTSVMRVHGRRERPQEGRRLGLAAHHGVDLLALEERDADGAAVFDGLVGVAAAEDDAVLAGMLRPACGYACGRRACRWSSRSS